MKSPGEWPNLTAVKWRQIFKKKKLHSFMIVKLEQRAPWVHMEQARRRAGQRLESFCQFGSLLLLALIAAHNKLKRCFPLVVLVAIVCFVQLAAKQSIRDVALATLQGEKEELAAKIEVMEKHVAYVRMARISCSAA